MAAFTNEQVTFIEWLSQDNLGKMIGYDSYTGHFQKRTLFKLKASGFLSESTCYIAGLRWQCCSLNQRGFEWLKQHGVQSHD